MKTYIDMEQFPRRTHFDFFRAMAFPYVGFTAQMDVTDLIGAAKERNGSSFLACLYAAANAANAVPELRQRIEGNGIVEYDHCDTAHTVALPDHTFCNCPTDCRRSFDEFLVYGKERQEQAKCGHGFNTQEDESDLIFVSCVPWIHFTQVIQPCPVPGDCNPRIVFGKFEKDGGKIRMPLGIQANHALVDGWHLGEFYRIFEEISHSFR